MGKKKFQAFKFIKTFKNFRQKGEKKILKISQTENDVQRVSMTNLQSF